MSNAKLLHAQQAVISQNTCNILAQCKLFLHHCSFYASVVHGAVNNFHFPLNIAIVCIKWKIYAQLHNNQTKYSKWTIHSHLQSKQAHILVCYKWQIAHVALSDPARWNSNKNWRTTMHANGFLTIFQECWHTYYSWKIV